MPAKTARTCDPPIFRPGADIREWAARTAEAFGNCAALHDDAVNFYGDVRTRLGGSR